ncbi:MAG: hypothetical protein OXC57_13660 [Rhodobacteraceae bacterium]|nr:hypothetical protein [Paracoccaceae bacterium]
MPSGSCIDSTVAITLNLPIINEQSVAGVHGAGKVNVHLAQIYIPALSFILYGAFFGVHLIAGGGNNIMLFWDVIFYSI